MSGGSATLPDVKGALRTALKARPGLANVQVSWGTPREPMPELVLLGDADGDQQAAALGNRMREENYTLTVHVDVLRKDGDQEKATRRAYVIAGEIEDYLRDTPDLGLVPSVARLLIVEVSGPFRLEEIAFDTDDVREAYLEVSLSVKARI